MLCPRAGAGGPSEGAPQVPAEPVQRRCRRAGVARSPPACEYPQDVAWDWGHLGQEPGQGGLGLGENLPCLRILFFTGGYHWQRGVSLWIDCF